MGGKEKRKQKKNQKEEITHRTSVGRERIAHDIKVVGHDTFLSKAIWTIGIDHPRDIWRINGLTSSKSPLLQFPALVVSINQERRERRRTKV